MFSTSGQYPAGLLRDHATERNVIYVTWRETLPMNEIIGVVELESMASENGVYSFREPVFPGTISSRERY